jgi:peptide chain release factor 1
MRLTDRLEALSKRFDEIEAGLAQTGTAFDQERYTAIAKERASIEQTVMSYRQYSRVARELAESERALATERDTEMRQLLDEEAQSLREQFKELEQQLEILMLPKDPDDDKDIFIEIRAGAGGDEAGLFAADLLRMYLRYADMLGMATEITSLSDNEAGGYKEVVLSIKGGSAYHYFKYESGVHRVQRVPATESQGRVHTSTATVAVLAEAEEVDVEINQKDLQIDTYKSSGAGGQHVNKTESAIRITHLPSGLIAASQQQRSQLQNRERAMTMLRSLLLNAKRQEADEAMGSLRRSQVGTGDRSEKIRTYNYPQDRITDHRINQNFQNIKAILDGGMERLISELQKDEQARLLAGELEPN